MGRGSEIEQKLTKQGGRSFLVKWGAVICHIWEGEGSLCTGENSSIWLVSWRHIGQHWGLMSPYAGGGGKLMGQDWSFSLGLC